MKHISKILAILATILLLACTVCIFAFAAETPAEQAEESQYAFNVYNPNTKAYTNYTNGSSLTNVLANAADGTVITFLKDTVITSKYNYVGKNTQGTADNATDIYLNLNGKKLVHATTSSANFLEIYGYVDLHVYSSLPGGAIMSTYSTSSGYDAYTLFNLRYDSAGLELGSVSAPVIELDNDETSDTYGEYVVTGSETHSGDNLSTYSASLVTTYYGSTSNLTHENIHATINGGMHYKTHTGRGAAFLIDGDIDLTVKNATFITVSDTEEFSFYKANNSSLTHSGNEITFENCKIIANKLIAGTSSKASVLFKNCYISCDVYSSVTTNLPELDGCRFTATVSLDTDKELVKTNETILFNCANVSYNYSGTAINTQNPYTLSNSTKSKTFVVAMLSDGMETVDITWDIYGELITEKWLKGDNVIPVTSSVPNSTNVYKYDFSPKPVSTSELEDTAYYEMVPRTNFTLKANISLYSDFIYNMYLPKAAVDSELFNFARVDRLDENGNVTISGSELPVKNGETVQLEVSEGVFVEYYVIRTNISAPEGDVNYRLVMNLDGYYGETFEHSQDFSIFDYAARINEGNYTAEAKAMVNATKTYIKAARNYFAALENPNITALPYPLEENDDLVSVANSAEAVERPIATDAVNNVFYGMTLSLEAKVKFRFYLYEDFTDTVTFTYPVNKQNTSVTISKTDCTEYTLYDTASGEDVNLLYYEISMRAVDLRGTITIDLASTLTQSDYTYNLSNYVYAVSGTNASLDTLMDALWAYSEATEDYFDSTTSENPTPAVDITVADNEITEETYVIVADEKTLAAAENLREAIYAKTGEMLTVTTETVSGKSSIFITVSEPSALYDFVSYVNGNDLILKCSYASFIDSAMTDFIEEYISPLDNSYDFSAEFNKNYYTDKIYYSDFGAYGVDMDAVAERGEEYLDINTWYADGLAAIKDLLTNDFFNMKAAHDMANLTGRHTVCADANATYYISETISGSTATQIVINSPVRWGTANIVIDDSDLPWYTGVNTSKYRQARAHVFSVESSYKVVTLTDSELLGAVLAAGLNSETTAINLGLGYPAMIIPYNEDHNIYRRKGYSSWNGEAMHELVVIDENGNIAADTPLMYDYSNLHKIEVYRLDIPEITIQGGTVTTISSRLSSSSSGYIYRGLDVRRSNTAVKDITHKVIGEFTINEQASGNSGASYWGFFCSSYASDVTFDGCVLQGRRYYNNGTYDLLGTAVNRLTLNNCTQSNFWITIDENNNVSFATKETEGAILSMNPNPEDSNSKQLHGGVGASNYCKNLTYMNSTLSRLDAHAGLYNANIIGCTVNYISISGGGTMNVEDVEWYAADKSERGNSIISLRNDYGSTWDGVITLKDVVAHHHEEIDDEGNITRYKGYIIFHSYRNWYYGYETHFPDVIVDNLQYRTLITDELLDATDIGQVEFVSYTTSFNYEPNLHLNTTQKISPYYPDVDNEGAFDEDGNPTGDGIVDNTNVEYDGKTSSEGVVYGDSNKNLNPVKAPKKIIITNNYMEYDFETRLRYYMTLTSFFDETEITMGTTDENGIYTITKIINGGRILDVDTPVIPWG